MSLSEVPWIEYPPSGNVKTVIVLNPIQGGRDDIG